MYVCTHVYNHGTSIEGMQPTHGSAPLTARARGETGQLTSERYKADKLAGQSCLSARRISSPDSFAASSG